MICGQGCEEYLASEIMQIHYQDKCPNTKRTCSYCSQEVAINKVSPRIKKQI